MTEPVSSAAGGWTLWKLLVSVLGVGVVASGLGFMVLPPKTTREFALRAIATMAGSALLGPAFVIGAYAKWPGLFAAAAQLATLNGLEAWFGTLAVAAPLLAMAGLPFWWLLGAAVLWFERRRGKDLGELAADARADVGRAVTP